MHTTVSGYLGIRFYNGLGNYCTNRSYGLKNYNEQLIPRVISLQPSSLKFLKESGHGVFQEREGPREGKEGTHISKAE